MRAVELRAALSLPPRGGCARHSLTVAADLGSRAPRKGDFRPRTSESASERRSIRPGPASFWVEGQYRPAGSVDTEGVERSDERGHMSSSRIHLAWLGLTLAVGLAAAVGLLVPMAASGQVAPGASVTVCRVSGSASAPEYAQVQVAVDQLAAYLNQNAGSFVGSCPISGGNGGAPPANGAVTVCRVSGTASSRVVSQVVVAADQVAAYLNQNPGSFVGACPASPEDGGNGTTRGTGPVNATVTVCRVTGSANAPELLQLNLAVDRVAAFVNQNPGSFIGTCPGEGGTVTQGPGRILGIPVGAALSICQVTGDAGALRLVQVNVAVERVAAYLNQHRGSFVGLCPTSGDPNGTLGDEPIGYVTICRVTGDVRNPLVPVTIRERDLELYLARPGTIVPAPTAGCPRPATSTPSSPPSTTPTDTTGTVTVQTTPNTVVTARGAGVNASTRSSRKGTAKLKLTPKKAGIVTVRGASGRVVRRIGVTNAAQSGRNLTG